MPEELVVEEIAETPDNSVPADETVEEDIVSLIDDGDGEVKPVLDKKEKALIKFKQRSKQANRENEELKARIAELEKRDAERSLAKPDPEKYDDGIEDERYAKDLESYITTKAKASVEETVAKKLEEERAAFDREAYLNRYETKITENSEKAIASIQAHAEKRPDFKKVLEATEFQETLARLPIAVTAKITADPNVALILEYYSKNPKRFANLANNDSEELLNLGAKMGQIKQLKSKKSPPNVINPLQGGDNTVKRDPIKDYDKYKLPDGSHDTHAWRKDMFGAK